VGRTDSTEGPQVSNATLTGFDYSDLTSYVKRAGEDTGIKVYNNARNSDGYFGASDNFSFAEAGVPAETLTVAFDFPDYHAVGDEWQKIDYENMAKVDRAIALAMFLMADSEQPVRWNDSNPKTAPFVKASKQGASEQPDAKQPDSKQPDSNQPDSNQPESNQPESKQPESKQPRQE
jgi:hypothetical protein